MTNKEIAELLQCQNLVRGYVYPYQGYRSEYWFEHSPSNIANFIMQQTGVREIIITDMGDDLILNTIGEFIDRCPDKELLQQILPHLIPMQMHETEPQEIPTATYEEVAAYYETRDRMEMNLSM